MALQPLALLRCESRAQRRHGVLDAALMELEHIEGPLHQHHVAAAADIRARPIQPKDQLALAEQGIGGGVAVLGLLAMDRAAGEAAAATASITDRQHQAAGIEPQLPGHGGLSCEGPLA